MPPKLKQYLNRSIFVAIPALFEDGKCREYILHSIETDGLWLSAPALLARLLPEDKKTAAASKVVFVPSGQIAAIILPPAKAPAAENADRSVKSTRPKPRQPVTAAPAASPGENPPATEPAPNA